MRTLAKTSFDLHARVLFTYQTSVGIERFQTRWQEKEEGQKEEEVIVCLKCLPIYALNIYIKVSLSA